MDNVPSAALDQQAPVLELNYDILGEIFERCDSLSVICRSSQVCRRWREFLLESPSLWARNIDLYALGHQSDCWRKLVLKRTGRALLSVTGGELTPWNRLGLLDFLVDLLDDHWARIRDLEITIARSALDDQCIWQAFGRPAPKLRTFSCLQSRFANVFDVILPVEILPPNFRLFSNHAPSLAGLYLDPTFPPINLNITPPTLFTSSLRNLKFTRTLRLTDIDLLTACMHMPFIETLSLSLERFFRSPPYEICALRPLVPRLKSIKLTDTDPSVYSAFLDRITPSAECALFIDNHLDAWSRLAADKASLEAGDIAHMGRVVGRYVNSYFEHEGAPLLHASYW